MTQENNSSVPRLTPLSLHGSRARVRNGENAVARTVH